MSVSIKDKTTGEWVWAAGGTINAFCPIGTILSFGGVTAPKGFLLCDGSAVSRTDYSALFAVIGTSFGAGDGSTTFNVPDLRGEFLRGAGTNSHTGQGNGGTVGEHQDATKIAIAGTDPSGNSTFPYYGGIFNKDSINADFEYDTTAKGRYTSFPATFDDTRNSMYAIRPTNTSVNYIIKAKVVSNEADIQQEGDRYSTDEVDTGKVWIDGKKIYRKVITQNSPSTDGSFAIAGTETIGTIILLDGFINNSGWNTRINSYQSNTSSIFLNWNPNTKGWYFTTADNSYHNKLMTLILEYTKA